MRRTGQSESGKSMFLNASPRLLPLAATSGPQADAAPASSNTEAPNEATDGAGEAALAVDEEAAAVDTPAAPAGADDAASTEAADADGQGSATSTLAADTASAEREGQEATAAASKPRFVIPSAMTAQRLRDLIDAMAPPAVRTKETEVSCVLNGGGWGGGEELVVIDVGASCTVLFRQPFL